MHLFFTSHASLQQVGSRISKSISRASPRAAPPAAARAGYLQTRAGLSQTRKMSWIPSLSSAASVPSTPSIPTSRPYANTLDFRSDTVTHPTQRMLQAAITSPAFLGDDVYHDSLTTNTFLSRMCALTGTERAALFPTATMANLASIMSHLSTPPHAILADHRSHVMNYEAGNLATVAGIFPVSVVPKNGRFLTLEDIKPRFVPREGKGSDVHVPPTRVVSLESPMDGELMPVDELVRIAKWVREMGARVHVDGARLWHAHAAEDGMSEVCQAADTVSLCFSKGLGAPGGSVVVGREECVAAAERVKKMLGGQGRQTGMMAAMMEVGIDEIYLGGKLEETHKYALEVARRWEEKGGKVLKRVETNMVWLDLAGLGVEDEERFDAFMLERGIKTMGNRLVFHFQHSWDSIEKLSTALFEFLWEQGMTFPGGVHIDPLESYHKQRSYRTS